MADSENESGGQNASYGMGNSEHSSSKEQDRFLPIANVSRIMKKGLPANAKISKDAKETVQECVSEFISFVTGEASDKCQREKRKTVNGDDLLWAMTTLGFEEYAEPLKVYLHKFRELEGEKAGASSSSMQSHQKDSSGGGAGGGYGGGGMYSGQQHHMYGLGMGGKEADLGCSWDSDDEYEKFIQIMNPPRVVIDNETSTTATIVRVDSANKYGILLEVVQVLTDLNLIIKKAYITSDGGWFMDVFNVTDRDGKKLSDEATISGIVDYIRKSLESDSCFISSRRRLVDVAPSVNHTSIELSGTDRPGLLSEMSAVLTALKCNVVNAEVWTHNDRAAAVMHVTDEATGLAITDPERLYKIKELLCNVLKGSNKTRGAKTAVAMGVTHTDRRLHQLMLADRDYERSGQDSPSSNARPNVTVVKWYDKDYSLVTIRCKDRPKLLFDTVCTLTDMQYVVFHGNVDAEKPEAYQEFYIKHIDGSPVNSEAERRRVAQCLEAAIERRVSEGLKLELCTGDKIGLLSEVTRIFRENSLTVTRAEITTRGGKAVNTFYVRDAAGYPVDSKIISAIRQAIGQTILQVKDHYKCPKSPPQESPPRFLFGSLFKSRPFYNFGFG